MEIRLAQMSELPRIMQIYADARAYMRASGNMEQWKGGLPTEETVRGDIASGHCHLCVEGSDILGVFAFLKGPDPTYLTIDGSWLNADDYYVIHRVAVAKHQRGVASFCFGYCYDRQKNLKIDTHKDNIPMQRALTKNGFTYCGIIHLANGDPRMAYQKSSK